MSRGEKTKLLWQNLEYREHMIRVHKENGLKPPSRKGIKQTEEVKDKLRKFWTGRKRKPISEEHKEKVRQANIGRTPWNKGKGTKTNYYKQLRNDIKYKNWRKKVFERDNYVCRLCKARNGEGKTIYFHPHHIKCVKNNPDLVFEVSNGATLCVNCHKKLHKKFKLLDYPMELSL